MDVARDAAAFALDGPRAQAPQQKQVLQRRPQMPHDAFKPLQILGQEAGAAHCPACSLPAGWPAKLNVTPSMERRPSSCLASSGMRGNSGRRCPSWRFQPNAARVPFLCVPANGGFRTIEEKDVALRQREVLRSQTLAVSRHDRPHEDPLQLRVAKGEDCLFAIEARWPARRASAAATPPRPVRLAAARQARQEFVLGSVPPVAVAHERQAHSARKRARHQRHPGKHLHPTEAALERGPQQNRQRHPARQHDGAFQAPANSRRQRHKQVQEPERRHRVRQQKENAKRRQIAPAAERAIRSAAERAATARAPAPRPGNPIQKQRRAARAPAAALPAKLPAPAP